MTDFILSEVRIAILRLLRVPIFSCTVIASLAVGLAAVLCGIAVIDGVVLRPLPFPDDAKLVRIDYSGPMFSGGIGDSSEAAYHYFASHSQTLRSIGGYTENVVSLTDRGEPQEIKVASVTSSVFDLLGTRAYLGRVFRSEDDRGSSPPSILISYALWKNRYGSDPGLIGRTIELNRVPRQVLGVLGPSFDFPSRETQVWYEMGPDLVTPDAEDWLVKTIARLSPAANVSRSRAELQSLLLDVSQENAGSSVLSQAGGVRVRVRSLKESMVGDYALPIKVLFLAALFLFALILTNLTNLFLIRTEQRRHEVAIKRALGASRFRLLTDFLLECSLLFLTAAALGIYVAQNLIKFLRQNEALHIPRLAEVSLSWWTIASSFLIAGLVSLIIARFSLTQPGSSDLARALKEGSNRNVGGHRTSQRILIAAQVLISTCLLIAAVTMSRSFVALKHVDLGFTPEGITIADIALPREPYPTYASQAHFLESMEQTALTQSGNVDLGATSSLPLTPARPDLVWPVTRGTMSSTYPDRTSFASLNLVTPNYLRIMNIPILSGRNFAGPGQVTDSRSVLISRSLARRLFPDSYRLGAGQEVTISTTDGKFSYLVIGVAGDVPGETLESGPANIVYLPVLPATDPSTIHPVFPNYMTLVLRSSNVTAGASDLRMFARSVDDKVPPANLRPLSEVTMSATAHPRLQAAAVSVASGVSLALAIIGIYGVTAYGVAKRKGEIAIRMALGATPGRIASMLLKEIAITVSVGTVLGAVTSMIFAGYLRNLVFQTNPRDPVTVCLVAVIFMTVALLAAIIPARSATRTDVNENLRTQTDG